MKKVSIIIRTKNEERWILACLKLISEQSYKNYEVIIVDNNSTDKTVEKSKHFGINKILKINDYFPGKAINLGVENCDGEYVVILSAHCLPVNNFWLNNLVESIEEDKIYAGVYGRQEPMSFSSPADKRDLTLVFGLDRKIQTKDSFFHNANSIIRKKCWEEIKFNENITNIEDRVWADQMLKKGYKILYEPEASVYHYHGINHHQDNQRVNNIVKIIEDQQVNFKSGKLDASNLEIAAIIPVKGNLNKIKGNYLINYTINSALKSKYIDRVIISTDNKETAEKAISLGAEAPFIRPKSLSDPFVNLEKVQQYSLSELENSGYYPDLIFHLEETFPFRTDEMLDKMILHLLNSGYDSVIAAKSETSWMWNEGNNGKISRIDDGDIPRAFKKQSYIGLHGLGCLTYSEYIRNGSLLGKNTGLFKIENFLGSFEVRDSSSFEVALKLLT